jgi:hypothetical protein
MKLHQEITQMYLSEDLLTESILSSLQAGVNSVKNYGNAIVGAVKAHKELKTLDGSKVLTTATLKASALEIRAKLIDAAKRLSDKGREFLDSALEKMGAAKLSVAYTSRNYYRDYLVYSMVAPAMSLTGGKIASVAADQLMDKIIGVILTAVTGIPSIDDIKDFADMGAGLVKASSAVANKLASLRPTDPGDEATGAA